MKLLMSARRNTLGWRIQPVLFVGPKPMNLDTGLLSLFQKQRRCGLKQTLRYCVNSRLMITSGKTRVGQSVSFMRNGAISSGTHATIYCVCEFQSVKGHGLDSDQDETKRRTSSTFDSGLRVATIFASHNCGMDRHSGYFCDHHHFTNSSKGHTKTFTPSNCALQTCVP